MCPSITLTVHQSAQVRSLRKAQDVRKQLVAIMDRYKLEITSCGRDFTKVCKAIVSGFFTNSAKKDPQEGYAFVHVCIQFQ
jgi:ATP-dependent RNA helicase DHX8/PRP22